MEIGIQSIGSYIPGKSIDNYKQAESFEKGKDFIDEKIGAMTLALKDEDQDTSDLAVQAVKKLLAKSSVDITTIDAIGLVTQNPDGTGLPHTSAIVQDKLGCSNNTAAFDISLGCSGYVYGLKIMSGFMEKAGLKKGLLITSDPYSKIINRKDPNTSLLFGDASTATLLSCDYRYSIGKSMFSTKGVGAPYLINNNGELYMNGRQIFNFAAQEVPKQINAILESEGLTIDDIDKFLLHQGSKYIVETLATKMKLDKSKVPLGIEDVGNTISSTIPLLLESIVDDCIENNLLLSGFGVGLSWGTVLINKSD